MEFALVETSTSPRDERELVREALAGSHDACRELVELYQDRLFRLMARFTRDPQEREDLVQEVFLKVFRHLGKFKFDSALYTWIYRVAVNAASDYLAARKRRPLVLLEDLQVVERGPASRKDPSGPQKALLASESRELVRRVLARLPEKFRKVLILREFEGLSYQEMAQVLGISMGTVESRLFRARKKFLVEAERLYPGFFRERKEEG